MFFSLYSRWHYVKFYTNSRGSWNPASGGCGCGGKGKCKWVWECACAWYSLVNRIWKFIISKQKKRRYVANFQVLVSLCFTKFRKSIQFLTLWEHDNKQFKNRGSGLVWLVVRRKTVFDLFFFIFQNFVKKLIIIFWFLLEY